MGDHLAGATSDGFLNSYCNTVPTPEGGTHEAGLARGAGARACKRLWRADGQPQGRGQITAEDVIGGAAVLLSRLHPRPAVPGPDQGEAGQRRGDPAGRGRACATISTTGCPATRRPPSDLLDLVIERAEERLRRREAEGARRARPRRASCACPASSPTARATRAEGTEIFLVEGDFGRRLGQAGARPRDPGGAAAARQDPERRQRHAPTSCAATRS